MPVRDAVVEDIDEICAMIGELAAFEQAPDEVAFDPVTLAEHLFGPSPAAHVLIAEPVVGSSDLVAPVAGMALWYRTFSTWVGEPGIWLEDLFVRPSFRRRGLATELMLALGERCGGGPRRLEWAVLDWNSEAIAFYRRLGAVPVRGWTRYRWVQRGGDGTPA